jgi:hypothetical protein
MKEDLFGGAAFRLGRNPGCIFAALIDGHEAD